MINKDKEAADKKPALEVLCQGAGFWTELAAEAGIASYAIKEALANNSYWPLAAYAGLKIWTNGSLLFFNSCFPEEGNNDTGVHRVLDEE